MTLKLAIFWNWLILSVYMKWYWVMNVMLYSVKFSAKFRTKFIRWALNCEEEYKSEALEILDFTD